MLDAGNDVMFLKSSDAAAPMIKSPILSVDSCLDSESYNVGKFVSQYYNVGTFVHFLLTQISLLKNNKSLISQAFSNWIMLALLCHWTL
jgi:hypothetical protein